MRPDIAGAPDDIATGASTFLNFAYGSNMLARRMRQRVPSASALGVAILEGHELRWHKVSQDGSGKCDVVESSGPARARVLGVVYRILLAEKPALDAAEGLGNGYSEIQVSLQTGGGAIQAQTYVAASTDPSAIPYTWYKALVIAGARENGFPEDYVSALQAMVAKVDPNTLRARRNFAIARRPSPVAQ